MLYRVASTTTIVIVTMEEQNFKNKEAIGGVLAMQGKTKPPIGLFYTIAQNYLVVTVIKIICLAFVASGDRWVICSKI